MVRAESAITGQLRRGFGMVAGGTDRDPRRHVVRRVGSNRFRGESIARVPGNGIDVRWSHSCWIRVECQVSKACASIGSDPRRVSSELQWSGQVSSRLWKAVCTELRTNQRIGDGTPLWQLRSCRRGFNQDVGVPGTADRCS
jgi:hypothetical protein